MTPELPMMTKYELQQLSTPAKNALRVWLAQRLLLLTGTEDQDSGVIIQASLSLRSYLRERRRIGDMTLEQLDAMLGLKVDHIGHLGASEKAGGESCR